MFSVVGEKMDFLWTVGPNYGVDRTMGLNPKVRTKIFNPMVRSDTPAYAPSDRTLGLNTKVRTNFGVENFQPHSSVGDPSFMQYRTELWG